MKIRNLFGHHTDTSARQKSEISNIAKKRAYIFVAGKVPLETLLLSSYYLGRSR